MKIVFDALFLNEKTMALVMAGEPLETFEQDLKNFVHKEAMIDGGMIESAIPHPYFKNHTTIVTQSSDEFTVKITVRDLGRILEHIDAGKLLCKLRN